MSQKGAELQNYGVPPTLSSLSNFPTFGIWDEVQTVILRSPDRNYDRNLMMSYIHEIQTVYNVVQAPQMVLLSEDGAHGVSVRREKVCMLLPQRSQGGTFENHAFHR